MAESEHYVLFRHYSAFDPMADLICFDPSDRHWGELLALMHILRVREWEERYVTLALDGYEWDLVVETPDLSLISDGSNAYPPGFDVLESWINQHRPADKESSVVEWLIGDGGVPLMSDCAR